MAYKVGKEEGCRYVDMYNLQRIGRGIQSGGHREECKKFALTVFILIYNMPQCASISCQHSTVHDNIDIKLVLINIAIRMTISQLQELSCVEFVGFQGCSQKE